MSIASPLTSIWPQKMYIFSYFSSPLLIQYSNAFSLLICESIYFMGFNFSRTAKTKAKHRQSRATETQEFILFYLCRTHHTTHTQLREEHNTEHSINSETKSKFLGNERWIFGVEYVTSGFENKFSAHILSAVSHPLLPLSFWLPLCSYSSSESLIILRTHIICFSSVYLMHANAIYTTICRVYAIAITDEEGV